MKYIVKIPKSDIVEKKLEQRLYDIAKAYETEISSEIDKWDLSLNNIRSLLKNYGNLDIISEKLPQGALSLDKLVKRLDEKHGDIIRIVEFLDDSKKNANRSAIDEIIKKKHQDLLNSTVRSTKNLVTISTESLMRFKLKLVKSAARPKVFRFLNNDIQQAVDYFESQNYNIIEEESDIIKSKFTVLVEYSANEEHEISDKLLARAFILLLLDMNYEALDVIREGIGRYAEGSIYKDFILAETIVLIRLRRLDRAINLLKTLSESDKREGIVDVRVPYRYHYGLWVKYSWVEERINEDRLHELKRIIEKAKSAIDAGCPTWLKIMIYNNYAMTLAYFEQAELCAEALRQMNEIKNLVEFDDWWPEIIHTYAVIMKKLNKMSIASIQGIDTKLESDREFQRAINRARRAGYEVEMINRWEREYAL